MLKPFATRTHEEMKDVLYDSSAEGPEVHYYIIRGGSDKKNITVWEVGTVGGEYIKTYGHYHVGNLKETYFIAEGEGIVLLQKRKEDNGTPLDDQIETIYAIKVKKGDSVHIPSGVGHLVYNTGKTWLVTIDDSPVNFEEADPVSLPGHADYDSVKKMRGFGYYLISENGEIKEAKNPTYKEVPELVWTTPEEFNKLHS